MNVAATEWLTSYEDVSEWMEQYDLSRMLQEHGGLVKIRNFLPAAVAEGALSCIRRIKPGRWNMTKADEDYSNNNISHKFWSVKRADEAPGLELLTRAVTMLLPGELNAFSAARYDKAHHIVRHDDRAYTMVQMEDGSQVECSRTVAVIYYLTKDWTEADGGTLIDCETGDRLVPEFNSAVAFTVPRYHEVTAVHAERPRFSIFGWFLKPGRLYDLYEGEDVGDDDDDDDDDDDSEDSRGSDDDNVEIRLQHPEKTKQKKARQASKMLGKQTKMRKQHNQKHDSRPKTKSTPKQPVKKVKAKATRRRRRSVNSSDEEDAQRRRRRRMKGKSGRPKKSSKRK